MQMPNTDQRISLRIENEIVSKYFLQLTNYNRSIHFRKLKTCLKKSLC